MGMEIEKYRCLGTLKDTKLFCKYVLWRIWKGFNYGFILLLSDISIADSIVSLEANEMNV